VKTHNNINVSTLNKWQEIILRIKLIINHITIGYCKGKLYICRVLFTHSLTHSHLLLLYNVLTFCEDEKWKMTTAGDEHCAFSSETEILVETNHCIHSIVRFWFSKSLVDINDIIQMIVWIGLLSNHWGFFA
jgi:hypothetical protein